MPFLGKKPTEVASPVDINSGTIDGATIGGGSAAPATVTTFTSNGIDDNADATAITIDSSEQVGIGTASPSDKLHVYGGSSGGTAAHSYTQLHVEHSSHAAIQLSSPASTESVIFFSDPDDNDVGGVGYYHAQDYLYLRSVGATRLRVDADGIKFGSDSAAANALDDYEEGTWTPTYVPSSGSFGSLSYGTRSGHYTKIGDLVTVHCRLDTSSMSIGSASGYLLVGGMPFTAHSSAYQSITIGYAYNFSSVWPTSGSTGHGMTSFYLYNTDTRSNSESIYPSNLGTSNTNLYLSATYKTT
jgi:hypothetical protein|tara:strand:+ start:881 stop:1780 length:900 start_codon:yes stop_codon:yes gene_type:complete